MLPAGPSGRNTDPSNSAPCARRERFAPPAGAVREPPGSSSPETEAPPGRVKRRRAANRARGLDENAWRRDPSGPLRGQRLPTGKWTPSARGVILTTFQTLPAPPGSAEATSERSRARNGRWRPKGEVRRIAVAPAQPQSND